MYFITGKHSKIVLQTHESDVEILENTIRCEGCYYVKPQVNVVEFNGELPKEFDVLRYCYTEEDGFYENPNYMTKDKIPQEIVNEIIDDYTAELLEEGLI